MAFERMLVNKFASMFLRSFTDDLSVAATSVCCLGLARNSAFWREPGTGVSDDLTRPNVADYTRLQAKVANSA
jgi:hypothetical protein